MSQQISPWLEGAYGWNFGESGWNTGMDQNLLKFSFMFDKNVDTITASLPAAVNGQAHYLTTDNRLYFAVGTTYFSTTVPKWFEIVVKSTGQKHQFNGTSLVQIDTPSQLDSRLDAVELTVTTLGTAAFQDIEFFATQTALDVAEANAANYTDQLRNNLADSLTPNLGAGQVGFDNTTAYSATSVGSRLNGLSDTSDDNKGSAFVGYKGRTQFSRNQDRPHIFDWIPVAEHTSIVAGTSLYDAAADFTAAIAATGDGGNIWLPQRGTILSSPFTVNKFGFGFRGSNSSAGFYSSKIKGITDGSPLITVTQPQFSMYGVALEGLSSTVEKGEDITQDAILLTAPTQSDNLDAVFGDCSFIYFREIIDMRGRNIRAYNCLFSNSRRAVLIANNAISDVRGLELYDCRYHSMGKAGSGFACIHAEPAANFSEIQVIGGDADDCLGMFTGFASNTKFDISQAKARGQGYDIDATAATSSQTRRVVEIKGTYQGEASAAGAFGALKATGAMLLTWDGAVMGCTGNGLDVNVPNAKLSGFVADAGQAANNSYDAVLLGASATTSFVNNLKITQDQYGAKTNKARYGLNNLAQDVEFGPSQIIGTFGTAQTARDTTKFFNGPLPGRPFRQSEVWGTAPPSGTFAQGSITRNTAPTRTKNISHWVVVSGGASPTWMAHGTGDGTTAERPTLGTNDRGYTYWDTNLSKIIYWNGSVWLV